MVTLLLETLYIFFLILEYLLLTYVFLSWIPPLRKVRESIGVFLEPLFLWIRTLLKRSVFRTNFIDFTPMIALVIIVYCQTLFAQLLTGV
ncbi:hypothetical protein lbkm_0929 [Lachnospiraceae bacterium KM106-2]|nr:hypothetical protein lbkm_0929 [Lachnospiraceae bacterium KM106-2]